MAEILGTNVLESYKCELPAHNCNRSILIIRFSSKLSSREKLIASDISTSEKISALINFGFPVKYHAFQKDTSPKEVKRFMDSINNDENILGVLIQNPVPKEYKNALIQLRGSKDLDAWNGNSSRFVWPITVEAVGRIIKQFKRKHRVAVVGSKGFIGSRIGLLAKSFFKEICLLDREDDLIELRGCHIIISAVGISELITKSYLSKKAYAGIDIGNCFDFQKSQVVGDFEDSAKKELSFYTPVPGSIGPLSIAILIERVYSLLGYEIENKWEFSDCVSFKEQ